MMNIDEFLEENNLQVRDGWSPLSILPSPAGRQAAAGLQGGGQPRAGGAEVWLAARWLRLLPAAETFHHSGQQRWVSLEQME